MYFQEEFAWQLQHMVVGSTENRPTWDPPVIHSFSSLCSSSSVPWPAMHGDTRPWCVSLPPSSPRP
uniref:Uncharacterized protein n=1 Tax=Arundo donax TaxID=35708 RepID=A0A0A9GWE0_ARUDO